MDNQADFTEVFGEKPKILNPNINTSQYYTSTARILYSFGSNGSWMCFYICAVSDMSDTTQ